MTTETPTNLTHPACDKLRCTKRFWRKNVAAITWAKPSKYGEVERFRKVPTENILAVHNHTPRLKDSPVYTFLDQLIPPALAPANSAPVLDGRSDPDQRRSRRIQKCIAC
jgi:hypothetical protein